jgi:signal transduction histidine kinase
MAINTVEECDNLIQMINTMLDITEAESGIAIMHIETVDLCTLVEDACALFSSLACEKGIRLQAKVLSRTKIITDKGKLQRIMANLLENAIKYTPTLGQVVVSAQMIDQQVRVEVSDTGTGIAPDEQHKIFQRFYRCDDSRSEIGMGLGLSLAKALAESLGGSLTVRSTLDQGSTFTFEVPTGATA